MLEHLSHRLQAAQDRLRAALVAGQPTEAHRQAIATIEADIEREQERQQQSAAEQAQNRAATITHRAAEIAAAVRERITASFARFPIPERP